jgi:hypothetical protein
VRPPISGLRSFLLDGTEAERRLFLCYYFRTFRTRLFIIARPQKPFFLSWISSRKGSVPGQDIFRIRLGSIELGFTDRVAICASFVCVPVFICFLFILLMRYPSQDPEIFFPGSSEAGTRKGQAKRQNSCRTGQMLPISSR